MGLEHFGIGCFTVVFSLCGRFTVHGRRGACTFRRKEILTHELFGAGLLLFCFVYIPFSNPNYRTL